MGTVKKVPMRQCTGCGEMKNKKDMVRILRTTENEIVLDATGRKNGRGAYLCRSRECFQKAVKSRGLERSRQKYTKPWKRRWKQLQKAKVLSYIGLATRARKSVSGEFSVENSVRKGKAKLVVVSEEASENTKKKIRSLCEYYKVPLYVACSSAELGSACGKEFRMSVAVEDEGLAAAAIRVLE